MISSAILFTIRYYDAFEHPLTLFEIWVYCFEQKSELHEVISTLDDLVERGTIQTHHGFYFLPGKIHLLRTRAHRYDISQKLWEKSQKAAKILSYLPFIEGVFINNSLAFFNCDEKSDIDFTIIATRGKIWTARFLSTVTLHLLGMRRHGKNIAGEVCLSLYLTRDQLNMESIKPTPYPFFLAFWIGQNSPILNNDGCFEEFFAKNSWIKDFLPNIIPAEFDYYTKLKLPKLGKASKKILGILLKPNWVEQTIKYPQQAKIIRSQKKRGNPVSVIFTDQMLKFHTDDWKRVRGIKWDKYLN